MRALCAARVRSRTRARLAGAEGNPSAGAAVSARAAEATTVGGFSEDELVALVRCLQTRRQTLDSSNPSKCRRYQWFWYARARGVAGARGGAASDRANARRRWMASLLSQGGTRAPADSKLNSLRALLASLAYTSDDTRGTSPWAASVPSEVRPRVR